jgi:hypothetical protein
MAENLSNIARFSACLPAEKEKERRRELSIYSRQYLEKYERNGSIKVVVMIRLPGCISPSSAVQTEPMLLWANINTFFIFFMLHV